MKKTHLSGETHNLDTKVIGNPVMRLKLFGRLRLVLADGSEITQPVSPIPGGLLAVLAAHKGSELTRSQIADLLWERESFTTLDNRLKQTIKNLRHGLAPFGVDEWIISNRSEGLLLRSDVTTDLESFNFALATSRDSCRSAKGASEKVQIPEIARELIDWRENAAKFLMEYDMDWVQKRRAALYTHWSNAAKDIYHALYGMADEASKSGSLEQANEYACLCAELWEKAPEAYALIMSLWARRGRPSLVTEWYKRWQYQMSIESSEQKAQQFQQDLYDKHLKLAYEAMISPQSDASTDQNRWLLTQSEQEAARLYTKGRKLWDERTEESLHQAQETFQEAIKTKADYSLAYSGCADTLSLMAYYGLLPPSETYARAMEMARQALRLDPDMAEGHTSMGWIALVYHWDWEGARQAFTKALELKNDYHTAHHWYSFYLMLTAKTKEGKVDLSLRHLHEAFATDPYCPIFIKSKGERYHYAGNYEKALEEFERSRLQAPHYNLTYFCMAQTLEQLGWKYRRLHDEAQSNEYFERAVEAFRDAAKHSENGLLRDSIQAGLAHALAGTKQEEHRKEAEKIVDSLLNGWTDDTKTEKQNISPYALAVAYLGLENRSETEKWLLRAAKERPGDAVLATIDPRFVRGGYKIRVVSMQLKFEWSQNADTMSGIEE